MAEPDAVEPAADHRGRPTFAHASEAEFARILDFYAVEWEYEPHVYPILWDLDGNVLESFAPDFYLPELDQYVEMTTLRQKLVRKKNRKLRRLRELYPDIRIKLFYARDFRALMLKYGRVALAESLSGTTGQVAPHGRPEPGANLGAGRLRKADALAPLQPAAAAGVAREADLPHAPAAGYRSRLDAGEGMPDVAPERESAPGPEAGARLTRAQRTRARRRARRQAAGEVTVTDDTRSTA